MKRYLLLALTTLPVLAAFGCKKTVPTVEAGAELDAAVAVVTEDAAAPLAEEDAGPAPTLAVTTSKPATPAAPKDAGPPAPGPFQGTYTCFAGMTMTQSGSTVSARMKPADTQNYSTFVGNVNGDSCEGTTTIYVGGKVSGTKKGTFKRNATSGDLTYKADGEPSTACHKK